MLYYASIKVKKPAVCFTDCIQTLVNADDVEEVTGIVKEFMKTQNIEILDVSIRPVKMVTDSITVLKSEDLFTFPIKKEQLTSEEQEVKQKKETAIQKALKTKMPFGKYKDMTLEELLDEDVSYLHWLIEEGTAKGLLATSLTTLRNKIEDLYDEVQANKLPEEYIDALAASLPNT